MRLIITHASGATTHYYQEEAEPPPIKGRTWVPITNHGISDSRVWVKTSHVAVDGATIERLITWPLSRVTKVTEEHRVGVDDPF